MNNEILKKGNDLRYEIDETKRQLNHIEQLREKAAEIWDPNGYIAVALSEPEKETVLEMIAARRRNELEELKRKFEEL